MSALIEKLRTHTIHSRRRNSPECLRIISSTSSNSNKIFITRESMTVPNANWNHIVVQYMHNRPTDKIDSIANQMY